MRFLPALLPGFGQSPDVTVIGAGVVGLATAHFLAKAGLSVRIVDRFPSPAALTSRRSGEGVRAQWELPASIRISRESIAIYRDFGNFLGNGRLESGYVPVGYLYVSRTAAGAAALAGRVTRQRAAGLDDVEYLGPEALRSRFPLLARDVAGGAFRQADGVVEMDRVVAGWLAATDAECLLGATVTGLTETPDGVQVQTSKGNFTTGHVVLANGAAMANSVATLAPGLEVRTARSTLAFIRTEGIPFFHPAVVDTDIGSFWRPNKDGLRITASFRGVLFVPDGTDDPVPDPDYLAHAVATAAPMVPRIAELAPHFGDVHLRSGTFAVTADGLPLIGPVPGHARLWLNGGYGGHGVMMSPAGGRILADALTGRAQAGDSDFSPDRFSRGAWAPEPMTVHLNSAER